MTLIYLFGIRKGLESPIQKWCAQDPYKYDSIELGVTPK